jgi:phosphatidylglycerophosphate synthase
MAEPAFRDAERKQLSFLATIEKKTLIWLAHRMPAWVNSDHLTLLGFLAMLAAGLLYWAASRDRRYLIGVIVALAINWFGDSLDGTLARVRHHERPRYGFYVDHMADIFGSVALMSGLALSGFLHWQTAIAMLIAFLILSGESFLATYSLSRFQLSQGIFGPTEIRILLVIGNLAILRNPYAHLFGYKILLFDLGGVIATLGMFAMAVHTTLRHTAQLYRQEPLP